MVFVGKFVLILGKFGKFEIVAIENLVEFVRLSTNKKKFLAISFTTLQLYGGLNHIILTLYFAHLSKIFLLFAWIYYRGDFW